MSSSDSEPQPAKARPGKRKKSDEELPQLTPEQLQKIVLKQITEGAGLCKEMERALQGNPAPELETLLKLHRVLILKYSLEAEVKPEQLSFVKDLMKPVMDWARLEEERKRRQLAE
ncbi:MAG TPA: hypothetical protein VEC99_16540, partial [Clostridia bacterium]|nr:hypothetical protein [Clostridia bacterium]